MFFYFDIDHPYVYPSSDKLGVYRVESSDDYMKAKEQLKRLQQLHDQMGQEKEDYDDESMAVTDAIMEQEKQIEQYCKGIDSFDSKYLSGNLEHILKKKGMKVSDLEGLLGVSAGYISRTMGADSKKRISIDLVWMIASIFQVNIDDLLNRDLTEPEKDLKQAVAFISKLKEETDEEIIHWKNHGDKPGKDSDFFYSKREDGKTVFGPLGEVDDSYTVKGIYSVYINIGSLYLVELEDILNDPSFRAYMFYEDIYSGKVMCDEDCLPLEVMFNTEDDTTGILCTECGKLRNAVKTHEKDFVISGLARSLMNSYLHPEQTTVSDEGLPFN